MQSEAGCLFSGLMGEGKGEKEEEQRERQTETGKGRSGENRARERQKRKLHTKFEARPELHMRPSVKKLKPQNQERKP